jgi:anaerobic selenocysteine-containing dehydrogenase
LFTKDKKIQLAPQPMLDDLPRLKAHLDKLSSENPANDSLQIISRLTNRTLGWMHHSHRLIKGRNPVELIIHPLDAEARDITADCVVRISTERGAIEVPVHISSDIMPGVVCLPHLWGHNRQGTRQRVANASPGASYNDLMGVSAIDELTGNAIFNGVGVHVTPIGAREFAEDLHRDEQIEEFAG